MYNDINHRYHDSARLPNRFACPGGKKATVSRHRLPAKTTVRRIGPRRKGWRLYERLKRSNLLEPRSPAGGQAHTNADVCRPILATSVKNVANGRIAHCETLRCSL